jgi:hypothetical protein
VVLPDLVDGADAGVVERRRGTRLASPARRWTSPSGCSRGSSSLRSTRPTSTSSSWWKCGHHTLPTRLLLLGTPETMSPGKGDRYKSECRIALCTCPLFAALFAVRRVAVMSFSPGSRCSIPGQHNAAATHAALCRGS